MWGRTWNSGESAESIAGEFLLEDGERWYVIRHVDRMQPFFVSVISNVDHWLFVSSTGGLTAGRVSPETALFPYRPVDRIHDSYLHTGSRTLLRVSPDEGVPTWEPFNREQDERYTVTRNLYKNTVGNKLRFEETNHDLGLTFSYTWATSERYGFVRHCRLTNRGDRARRIEVLDGLLNILPAGVPRATQEAASNLVDAYKWSELDEATGHALYALYAGISDRAEPCESLRANSVFSLGFDRSRILLSARQLGDFREGRALEHEPHTRGIRGAYLINAVVELAPGLPVDWKIVADIERSQTDLVALRRSLAEPARVAAALEESIAGGTDELERLMAGADGFQATAEENVACHHYANVLFNVLRGGIFSDHYQVPSSDLLYSLRHFNGGVYRRNREFLEALPETLDCRTLLGRVEAHGDPQLERLCREYLPITFGRRHGDPSRPWNQFEIRPKDSAGQRLLSYQGNWRDIFQNWEALTFSYPEFVENVIAKFVNASTLDGYNPYRITKQGIDWEVEDPEDPWSYIGYWGDHQIIYLEKLLELSRRFHPQGLEGLLRKSIFCYANVPYRIRPFDELVRDPKNTVVYDYELGERIARRVEQIGADGKLVLDDDGHVYLVNLTEKLLVPLLAKLGNLVPGGGIWLNTQRPEWNDANNALVGAGLSMVTLYYMRRYIRMLQALFAGESGSVEMSQDVGRWLEDTAAVLREIRRTLEERAVGADDRFRFLSGLGLAASRYRESVYGAASPAPKAPVAFDAVTAMLDDALAAVEHSIAANRRHDGLYHAYNLMSVTGTTLSVTRLYPMLEGQVAALSSGAIAADEACAMLEALFASDLYRADQHAFMLYPDRELPGFLEKNRVPADDVEAIPLLGEMIRCGDERLVGRDPDGHYRFNAAFRNAGDLTRALDTLSGDYGEAVQTARQPLLALYESVFDHRAFTGRSGTMFGFEGLGCIYWHMVAKLLLAVQERFYDAAEEGASAAVCHRLGRYYYEIRRGLGFNKSPADYGAFPTDPYSHTPKHAGAQQPGMTGQVKEEVLTRFGELGLRVDGGALTFRPILLREREFSAGPGRFRFLDVAGHWQTADVPTGGLAFTWCQVPIIYRLGDDDEACVTVERNDGDSASHSALALPQRTSREIFRRTGAVRRITVTLPRGILFRD